MHNAQDNTLNISFHSDPGDAKMHPAPMKTHVTYITRQNLAGELDFFAPDTGIRLSASRINIILNDAVIQNVSNTLISRQPTTWTTTLHNGSLQEIHALPFGPDQCIMHIRTEHFPQTQPEYLRLFSSLPVPLWEMDFSLVHAYLADHNLSVPELQNEQIAHNTNLILKLASLVIIKQINPATLTLLRIGPEDRIPNSIIPFLCHESPAILWRILFDLLENRSVLEIAPLRTIAGSIAQVMLKIIPFPGSERTWKRMLAVSMDITTQYQQMQTLGERNHLLENVCTVVSDLLWAKDTQGRYLYANTATQARLFPHEPQSLIGKTDLELADMLHEQGIRHTLGDLCVSSDLMILHKRQPDTFVETGEIGGTQLSLEVTKSPFFDRNGHLIGTIGTAKDITKQQEADTRLKNKEQELRLILDQTNDGVWQADNHLGLFCGNARFYTLLGHPSTHADQEFSLRDVMRQFIHPDDRRKFLDIIDKYQDVAETTHPQVIRMITKDGQHKWFSSRWTVVDRDIHGNPRRFIGVITDVTRDKERESEENLARQRAENLSKIKENFLANMSHEIRTPLNGMLGMLQLLESMISTPEQQHYLRMAVTAGRNLLCIINDVLDFTKMESGKLALFPHPFHLRESLETLLETLRAGAFDKHIRLELHVDPEVPDKLFADRVRLAQILFNLIGNALKFTDQGEVRLEVSLLRQQGGEAQLLFSVIDTGIGMPAHRLDEAFKPYTQLADPAAHRPGTGLGLGIVRNLVNLMHGSLVLDSEEGQGTTASFALTMRLASSATRSPQIVLQTAAKSKHVLVVEDDQINLLLLEAMIKKLGHSSKTASNGLKALKLLETESFDCILMDVQMPILDGLETTRRIREGVGKTPQNIPIIGLSAFAMKGDRERFIALGMTDYLAKPVDLFLLGKVLAKLSPSSPALSGGC